MMNKTDKATLVGSSTILMWSTLAFFTLKTGNIPPFQLVAMAFSIAFLLVLAKWLYYREPLSKYFSSSLSVWVVGVGGLFGYHFFYFMALKNAPAVEANLINYLWPVLIVLLSSFLPKEQLRWFHIVGAFLGVVGCFILVTQKGGLEFNTSYTVGYLAALACAVIWSVYSVLSRCLQHVATDTVGWFCLGTAILAGCCHTFFEVTVIPSGFMQWAAIIGLSIFPVGLAFFTWDYGMKWGDIKLLGVLSYAAPLLSTLLLIIFTDSVATWQLGIACILIIGGALIASKEHLSQVA